MASPSGASLPTWLPARRRIASPSTDLALSKINEAVLNAAAHFEVHGDTGRREYTGAAIGWLLALIIFTVSMAHAAGPVRCGRKAHERTALEAARAACRLRFAPQRESVAGFASGAGKGSTARSAVGCPSRF